MTALPPSADDPDPTPDDEAPESGGSSSKILYIGLSMAVGIPIIALVVALALSLRGETGPEETVRAYVTVIDDENCDAVEDLVSDRAENVSVSTVEDCEHEVAQWRDTMEWWADDVEDAAYGFEVHHVARIDDPERAEIDTRAEHEQAAVVAVVRYAFSGHEAIECGENTFEFLLERVDGTWKILEEHVVESEVSFDDDC